MIYIYYIIYIILYIIYICMHIPLIATNHIVSSSHVTSFPWRSRQDFPEIAPSGSPPWHFCHCPGNAACCGFLRWFLRWVGGFSGPSEGWSPQQGDTLSHSELSWKLEEFLLMTQIGMVKMYEVIHNHDHRICDFCLLAATGARRRDDSWHVGERQEPVQSRSVIPKMVSQNRTPIAGWFIWKLLETPFKMDDIGGTPMTLETSKDGLKAKHTFENHKASFSLSCSTSWCQINQCPCEFFAIFLEGTKTSVGQ
jgi:hypothetical protein